MLVDYHVHTPYCGHAHGKIFNYVENAIQMGITEIGFADHLGRYYLTDVQRRRFWDWGMDERDLSRYFSELTDLKDVFDDQIRIKIGLEIDYIEGAEDLLIPILDRYPFDFGIGSIHCMPRFGWKHLTDYQSGNSDYFYKEYFRLARSAIRSNLFQSLAHLDFIWRYIKWPPRDNGDVYADISETIKTAKECGMCIEINANGYMWSVAHKINGKDPFDFMLDQIKLHGTAITIGSDAHEPDMVGKAFPSLITRLHEKGIDQVSCFTDKEISTFQLN